MSLEELENIKTSSRKDEEVKYKARCILHLLDEHDGEYEVIVFNNAIESFACEKLIEITPDVKIMATCAFCKNLFPTEEDVIFITNDISCKMIAKKIFNLTVKGVESDNEIYRGYREVCLNEEDMAHFYENLNGNIFGLYTNEYLILKDNTGKSVDRLKWDGEMYQTVRCKSYKSNMLGTLKPLDDIQAFAMDSINTNDITVLYGKAGSGKTTLPLNYIMQEIEKERYRKCYVVYSYEPLKGAKTLGYEKGDHITKLLYSASIGNILASKFGDMKQVEYMVERDMLEIIPTANIRGWECPEDCILLSTESQNLDVYTLKTLIQRCKTGCKQIYEGDIIEQKDTNIQNIGMNRLIDVFKGHKSFGCVKLKNNYRSELSELADLM